MKNGYQYLNPEPQEANQNLYASDGVCHNAEKGSFNHECEQPAEWLGTDRWGWSCGFCDDCRHNGYEAKDMIIWCRIH